MSAKAVFTLGLGLNKSLMDSFIKVYYYKIGNTRQRKGDWRHISPKTPDQTILINPLKHPGSTGWIICVG